MGKQYSKTSLEENQKFIEAWESSDGLEEVAKKVGLSKTQVKNRASYLRRIGIDLKQYVRGGGNVSSNKDVLLETLRRARGTQEWTVIGVYLDNLQRFSTTVRAASAKDAEVKVVESITEKVDGADDFAVVAVIEGRVDSASGQMTHDTHAPITLPGRGAGRRAQRSKSSRD